MPIFLKDEPSYKFNFIGHIAQFWNAYYKMYEKQKKKVMPLTQAIM